MRAVKSVIRALDKVGIFSRWMNVIGIISLFSMIFLNFLDVILDTRWIQSPIIGSTEITEVMMIIGIFLAVGHSQNEKAHITVDIVTQRLKGAKRLIMEFLTTFLSMAIIGILVWRLIDRVVYTAEINQRHSQYMPFPVAPFTAIIALGCTLMTILMIRDMLKIIVQAKEEGFKKSQWLLLGGLPIIVTLVFAFFMQPDMWSLSLPLVAVIGIVVFIALLMAGMPIAFAMMLTGVVFISHIRGSNTAFQMFAADVYRNTGTYAFSVLPFFVMLGFFCFRARFGEDLYDAGYKWFGHLRGGMSIATVAACTGFAAIVGDPVPSTATMGSIALPQMQKLGYSDKLSTGCVLGGASLGPIIPPSSAFILVGLLTGVPVGRLLISGILPGLLMAGLFIAVIVVWCRLRPKDGPVGGRSGWKDRAWSLRAGGPVLIIFLVVIGGIYLGIFTPTRGGAVGAVAAFFLALLFRRYTWKTFVEALMDSGRTISIVFLLLIGGLIFSRFMAWCNLSSTLATLINGWGLSANVFVLIVMVLFFLLGLFIDIMPLMLLGIPIVFPISQVLGVDPIWFCLLLVVVINLGGLTPPVGVVLFVLKGIRKDIPMSTIFRGVIPFVGATVVAIVILYLLPQISTWLPSLMK